MDGFHVEGVAEDKGNALTLAKISLPSNTQKKGIVALEAVIFIGIPATGKSTFYKKQFFRSHVRINLDMLRTRHREYSLVRSCLETKQPFVVDNTNPTREDRQRYLVPAKTYGFKVVGY